MFRTFALLINSVLLFAAYGQCHEGHGHHHHDQNVGHQHDRPSPKVTSASGVFLGSWMQTRRGKQFQGFRGIRYAEAPVGDLRFQAPKPILQYSGEVDASKEGPACPQPTNPNYYNNVDEDCLRLNVYTHGSSGELRPVVIFIHAGGFYAASGRSDIAGPDYFLDKDIVLVTINYRLSSLGFLSTGDELAPGNNGYKDQVMAMRWVQRNIASFGGDPNLVTIAGYSAGSFSVMLHTVSPMSKGLFHRAISMSGSPISQVVIPHDQRQLAVRQAELLDCPTNSSRAIIDCLKTKPWRDIGNSLHGFFEFAYDPVLIWVPLVEKDYGQERFLVKQPLDSIRQREIHSVPYIISQTQDEFFWKALNILANQTLTDTMNNEWERIAPISFYLPASTSRQASNKLKQAYLGGKDLVNDTASADGLGKLYNDAIIGFGVHRLVNLMSQYSSKPVYYYEFAYIGNHSHYEDPVTKKPTGAAHHDELIYLFSVNATFPFIEASDSLDSNMVDKMTSIWYNFLKNGDPNPRDNSPELSGLSWPAMKPDDRKYLRIDKTFSVHENLFEDRFKIWEELYPITN